MLLSKILVRPGKISSNISLITRKNLLIWKPLLRKPLQSLEPCLWLVDRFFRISIYIFFPLLVQLMFLVVANDQLPLARQGYSQVVIADQQILFTTQNMSTSVVSPPPLPPVVDRRVFSLKAVDSLSIYSIDQSSHFYPVASRAGRIITAHLLQNRTHVQQRIFVARCELCGVGHFY